MEADRLASSINRPQQLNALNDQLMVELGETLKGFEYRRKPSAA